ncbi:MULTISPECIES: hypothetical protein [Neomicrococcus]|uniref:hypothetical protein n=1 Tax=Micrococcales TaxID=85006 RepID=UPI002300FAEA|nr:MULTISPECIES: hypothetical protein [Neomicrococcus]
MVPCFGVVVVVLCKTVIDRGDLSTESILELRELLQAQGIFQVRFEEPVLLCDVLCTPASEVGDLG